MAAGETSKREPRVKGKENIRDILKKAVDDNAQDDGENKPRKTAKSKKRTLERIKSGEDLLKDQDDTVDANTYEPEEKNVRRRRDKSRKGVEGIENPNYENDEKAEPPVAAVRPSARKSRQDQQEDAPMTIDELVTTSRKNKKRKTKSPSPAAEDQEPLTEEDAGKKKKDKKKMKKEEQEIEMEDMKEETKDKKKGKKKKKEEEEPQEETKLEEKKKSPKKKKKEAVDESEPEPEVKEKKKSPKKKKKESASAAEEEATAEPEVDRKKKKKKKKSEIEETEEETQDEVDEVQAETAAETAEAPEPAVVADDGRILGVTVHRTDKLVSDLAVSHPMVKVSVVDEKTGAYIKKQTLDRNVTSFYESTKRQVESVLPIITQPYDFRAKRSVIPDWNEMVLFNENFNHFTGESPRAVIFFELVDFVSMNQASDKYGRGAREDGGWHRIAWAFLKVRGANGSLNTDKRTRLQLFRCPSRFKPAEGSPDVYTWWRYYPRDTYPSTLYVTVKSVVPPESLQPAARSMIATQAELGSTTYKELRKSLRSQKDRTLTKKASPALWGRLPGQMCKIPNSMKMALSAGRKGCYVVKFSNDGRLLACGCQDRQDYTIMLYEIPSGKLKVTLTGHYGLIYDLSWSKDDKFLVSASGDGTARVWDAETLEDVTDKLLPHPSFVYTAKFHSKIWKIVATGGFDCMIRIWDISGPGQNGQLVQEIDYHQGHVNSLCFDQDGGKLYSADNVGVIVVWAVHVTENPTKPPFLRDWSLFHEIRDEELRGTPISEVKVFYGDRRLLVQSRDNTIRMIDLRVFSVMMRYMGSLNFREHIHSTVTPCGSFVMAGSEDNVAYVWNTETGDQVAMYDELNYTSAVTDVDFHPHEHMAAFCSYGENQPVMIYTFDPAKATKQTTPVATATKAKPVGVATPVATVAPFSSSKPPVKPAEDSLTATFREDSKSYNTYDSTRYSKIMQKLGTVVSATGAFRENMEKSQQADPWGSFGTGTFGQSVSTRGDAWRPGFSSVGRMGQSRDVSMKLDNSQGKAQFTFKASKDELDDSSLPKCVVLYDYKAARSDELDLLAGETVSILYKDNDNWWMGQIGSRQGYFPSNYVEEQRPEDDLEALSSSDDDEAKSKKKMADLLANTGSGTASFRARSDSVGSASGRSAARQRRNSRQMDSTA